MAKKPHDAPVQPTSSKPPSKRVGRPPSTRAVEYLWYRTVEGFEGCGKKPWWERIDWEKQVQANRAARSVVHRDVNRRVAHGGYLWETLRRLPEFQNYEEQPLPMMFLKNFAILRPCKETSDHQAYPQRSFCATSENPRDYPWLSFGILERVCRRSPKVHHLMITCLRFKVHHLRM